MLNGEKVVVDIAMSEYLHWRNGEPMATSGASEMTGWAWRGFCHLCRTWGKEGKPTKVQPMSESVERIVTRMQAQMNALAPDSQSLPVLHGL